MKKLIWVWMMVGAVLLFSADPLTRAERTEYGETSLYADVLDFLSALQPGAPAGAPGMKIATFCTSTEGRLVPLVILSEEGISHPRDLTWVRKPVVLIMANIHAGEVEGKEACLMLIRDIVSRKLPGVLDNLVLLVIPIFNADGNEKIGHNRRDQGPELAGVRPNGQNLDLNRDYLKLESPEVGALVRLFQTWDPMLIVDMHTTNGSYHQHPVTYTTSTYPNTDENLRHFMWQKLFPAVAKTLKTKYGYDSLPYGNFADRLDPNKGWADDSIEPRYGSNYGGLRNRFTILDENYSYADFKTRVLSSLGFIKSILEFCQKNGAAMRDLTVAADASTAREFVGREFTFEYKVEKLFDLTVKSFEFSKEKIKEEDRAKYPPWVGEFLIKKTDVSREYRVPYLALPVATRTRPLPEGYIILPFQEESVDILRRHGIHLERLLEGYTEESAQAFKIEKIETEKAIYQGHVMNKIKGDYETRKVAIPKGAIYVSLRQTLARLAAVLLEPECVDSLASWGFFNRSIVQQWTSSPADYPVVRLPRRPPVPTMVD